MLTANLTANFIVGLRHPSPCWRPGAASGTFMFFGVMAISRLPLRLQDGPRDQGSPIGRHPPLLGERRQVAGGGHDNRSRRPENRERGDACDRPRHRWVQDPRGELPLDCVHPGPRWWRRTPKVPTSPRWARPKPTRRSLLSSPGSPPRVTAAPRTWSAPERPGSTRPLARSVCGRSSPGRIPGSKLKVVHDTHLILAAASVNEGIVVISGTGSVAWGAYGRWHHSPRRRVGLPARRRGQRLRHRSSGRTSHAATRRRPPPGGRAQHHVLLNRCGVASADALLDDFYARPEPGYLGSQGRDRVRTRRRRGRGHRCRSSSTPRSVLADFIRQVHRALGRTADLPVVLGGGVLVHQPALGEALRQHLHEDDPHTLITIDRDPAHGAIATWPSQLSTTHKETTDDDHHRAGAPAPSWHPRPPSSPRSGRRLISRQHGRQ